MKILFSGLLTTILLSLPVSCVQSVPEDATINAENIKIDGINNSVLEVVNDAYTLSAKKKSKDSDTWIVSIRVKFSKKQEVDLSGTKEAELVLLDENNSTIEGGEMRIGESSIDTKTTQDFIDCLTGPDTGQFVCCFHLYSSDEELVSNIMNNAKSFKVIIAGNSSDVTATSTSEAAIHQAAIINDPDGYTNVRIKPDGNSKIVAKIVDGEKFFFDEVPGSKWVKVYRTANESAECIGYMHSSRVMPVGGGIASMTDDDITTSGESDPSIDKYLDEYEKFVDNYTKLLKKMDKEDPTFAIEYAKVMQNYQELANRGQRLSSNMSASQLERLNKITMRMAEEIQKAQN